VAKATAAAQREAHALQSASSTSCEYARVHHAFDQLCVSTAAAAAAANTLLGQYAATPLGTPRVGAGASCAVCVFVCSH
jgi:hypothetical protein